MPEAHNSLFLFSEQFDNAPGGIKLALILIPLTIIALVIVAILKKKKKNTVVVPSVVSKTTQVTPDVPVTPVESTVNVKTRATPVSESVPVAAPHPGATILVIEDDNIMLLAIRSILAKSGYNLIVAKDGKEAFEKLDTESYDVVVTDLMMPYANGLEVVSKIRSDMSKRHVSIIVCSSVGNEETITEAFRLGADDYLKKPIKAEELVTRVRLLLERRTNNPKLVTKKTTRVNV